MAKSELVDFKSLYKLALRYTDNLCFLLTSDFLVKEVNIASLNLFQWKRKELIGQNFLASLKGKGIRPSIKADNLLKKSKITTHLLTKKKRLKISWNILPLFNKEKKVESIFIIGKLINNLSTKNIQHLQLDNVVKFAPGFFYWKDKNSVYLGCNDEFASLAGLKSRFDVIGKTDFDLIWKDRAQEYVDVDQEVMRSGEPRLGHEEKVLTNNDKTIIAVTNKVPLRDYKNNIVGMMGITIDITKQKLAEDALSLAKLTAENANMLKTNFIQNMQHDIRTPVSSIWAVLDYLVEHDQTPDKNLLILLKNSSEQLLNICNDVIDFERTEKGDFPLLSKPLNVEEVLSNIIKLNQIAAFERGLSLSLSISKEVPPVLKGDEHRLSRILINLIGNALKFTPQGYIKLSAHLLKDEQRTCLVQFKLEDTGIGIAVEKQNTLYEKFNRMNPANQNIYKGSGLGLRIVKKFVDDLEGEINVKSDLNQGTTFYVNIPFDKILDESIYLNSNNSNLVLAEEDLSAKKEYSNPIGLKILLIEDSALALKIGKKILESLQYEVSTEVNVKNSLDVLNKVKFDLVIADIGLPDGTGIDLIKIVKGDNRSINYATPFFVLSANSDKKDIEKYLEAGFLKVLQKPLRKEILQPLINEVLITTDYNRIPNNSVPLTLCGEEFKFELPHAEKKFFELEQYPIFDEMQGLKISGGNATLRKILRELINTIPQFKLELSEAHKTGDWELIENLAHNFKSGAIYAGTLRMQYACHFIECCRKEGESETLEKLYEQLIQILGETQQRVTDWFEQISF